MFTGKSNFLPLCIFKNLISRNQLRFIWNRINSKPVITVTLRVDEKITLLPSVDDWLAAVRLHIFDLAPSIGLALQRAQHAHPNSLILNTIESKLFLTLQNDPEASGSKFWLIRPRMIILRAISKRGMVFLNLKKVESPYQKNSEQN